MTAACTSFDESTPITRTTVASAIGSGTLRADVFNNGVFCDGTERKAAVIFEAEPGETIAFSSPMPVEVADGVADEQGTYQLLWSCEPNEASLSWDLTATGTTSNRSVSFRLIGSYEDPGGRTLVFTPTRQPLVCDGTSHVAGRLENADPYEPVNFTAADAEPLRQGQADRAGVLTVNWRCRPEESQTTWTVEAIGERSGRVASFEIAGRLPEPAETGPINVELLEDPVICNRERWRVAVLSNLVPGVLVDFVASPSDSPLGARRADGNGSLDVYWQCHRSQADTVWTLEATEHVVTPAAAEQRTAKMVLTGSALPDPTMITVVEEPFVCDGTSHDFAVLSNFVPGEYVDFTSPQSDAIRPGQADEVGELPVHWQCDPDEAGKRWEVTASGQTSGYSLTFTVTGG